MVNDNTVTCGDCGAFVAATADADGLWKLALANHRRFCSAARPKPAASLQRMIPRPITTTKETPMEKPTMPAPETLLEHDNRRVAKAAERVLVAQEALREAWEADAGKAALRAKRDRLKAQLAEVEAELKGTTAKPKPAPAPEAKVDSRDVRIWALTNGYDVPERGPLSAHIRAAYDEAMRGGAA